MAYIPNTNYNVVPWSQLMIETVVSTNMRGWTAIDDFIFAPGDDCSIKPQKATPAELGHDCSFDTGLCGQWYEISLPGESFWNVTSGKELETMGIEGPIVDHNDNADGMKYLKNMYQQHKKIKIFCRKSAFHKVQYIVIFEFQESFCLQLQHMHRNQMYSLELKVIYFYWEKKPVSHFSSTTL